MASNQIPMSWLSETDYNFIYSRAPRICVDLVIKTHSSVHLVEREISPYKGKFHLPGGRVRFRESIEKAIQRIAKDEIGINVKIDCLLGYMEFPREVQAGNKRHSISLAFLVRPVGKLITKVIKDKYMIHPVHYKFLKAEKLI